MISAEALSRLLLVLYSAPASPELWPKFLEGFVDALGISGGGIVCQDEKRIKYGYQSAIGIDPEGLRAYHAHYGKQDPQIPPIRQIVPGRISFGYELCDPEQFRRTEYFNDFAGKYDICLYCALPTSKTVDSVEAVTCYTGFRDKPPGKQTLDLVTFMIPHLQSALHLRRRLVDLKTQSSSLEAALDLVEYGIILSDSQRHVLRANRAAEDLLRKADGLSARNGMLEVLSKHESAQLNALIEQCANTAQGKGTGSGGSMLISRQAARPLTVAIAPLRNFEEPNAANAVVAVFVYDPNSRVKLPAEVLERGYGLTSAEARLALILVEGKTLKDAASECGVTHNTVRSQLQSIFLKTGVRHQGELIRLLLRSGVKS